MITVANPVYDVVFKYLMEDQRIACTILSALLKEDIVEVEMRPHEYVNDKRDSVSVLRIDFGARVRQSDGSERLILIELQKTWLETETLRFRQYLGVQYDNPDNMLAGGEHALPMVAVYLLGHRVGDIDEPVLYVKHKAYNYDEQLVTKGLPNPFVDSLTHDSIIVQIPLLRGLLTRTGNGRQYGRRRLDRVLSIFDQSNGNGRVKRVLEIDESLYKGDDDMEHVIQRLALAVNDAKLRQDMNIEEEFISAIERRDTEILNRDYALARQKVIIDEQKSQIDEQKSQIDEQKSQIDEQKSQIDEQKSQIDEQKSQMARKDETLKKSIQMLRAANLSVEIIASNLGLDVDEVRRLME